MRVAALYDVHGNLPALEAVLADVARERVDAVVSGGDVVWGPLPAETLQRLEGTATHFVRGNADRDVAGADHSPPTRWCRDRLSPEELARVAAWPETVVLDVDGLGRVLFCHASPRSDTDGLTEATTEAAGRSLVAGADADVVVCGHTHHQFDRRLGGVRVVNAGSVGLPYEGRRGAFWALLGPEVELRRTDYDVDAALPALVGSGFPVAEPLLGRSLVAPVPKAERVAFFESQRG